MFRGNHPTRVDEKGRLKVPAEFKRVIDEKYGQQFYITSLDGKVAQVYPFEEWERIEQKLAGLSSFNPTKKKFLDRTNYYGQQVEMDGQGRLLLPQLLREAGQIKGEVAVLGNLTYLVVRNLELFKKEIETEKFTPEDEKTLDEPWQWRSWPCFSSFKRSDRLFGYPSRRDLYRRHGGAWRPQFRNRKAPRPTGSFDWLR